MLGNLKVKLSKRQLSKLKTGGTVTITEDTLNGEDSIQISNSKLKKIERNHKKGKGYRLKLSENELLNGEGVQSVGNMAQEIVVPKRKILDGGCSGYGFLDTPAGSSKYNTFVTSNHPAMNPALPSLDQSYLAYKVKYTAKDPMVKLGGRLNKGSPMHPIPFLEERDQSH